MLSTLEAAKKRGEFFLPPKSKPEEPKPEFTTESAAATITASEKASQLVAKLQADEQASIARFEEAEVKRLEEREANGAAIREAQRLPQRGAAARQFLLRDSQPTESELEAEDRGLELMKQSARIRATHQISVAEMEPPEESRVAKELEAVQEKIRNASPLAPALPNPAGYERDLEMYKGRYRQFLKAKAAKEESDAAFAERDRLRAEREEAVIDAAMATAAK